MQVLNQNSLPNSTIGLNLPKPVPPQSVTPKTNTPVKNALPVLAKKNNTIQKVDPVTQVIPPVVNQPTNLLSQDSKPINQHIETVKPIATAIASTAKVVTTPTVKMPNLTEPLVTNPLPTTPTASIPGISTEEKLVPIEEIAKKDKQQTNKKEKNKAVNKLAEKGVKKTGNKRIPTILAVLILIVSLIAGVFLFGDGTGLFTPRATPETTPSNITLSNITDKSFTVSFYTEEETIAFLKYGTSADDIKQQVSDDRDQLSGVIKPYRLHHITARGLESNKNYYYVLGVGSKTIFDDAGKPYQIQTAIDPGSASPNNQTIYGTVVQQNGQPGEGAIVFVTVEGAGVLSTVVKQSGSWAISLANAFNLDFNNHPNVDMDSTLSIKVQGIELDSITNRVLTLAEAQPAPEIVMGQQESDVTRDLLVTNNELLTNVVGDVEDDDATKQVGDTADNLSDNALFEQEDGDNVSDLIIQQPAMSDAERTLDLTNVDVSSGTEDNIVGSTQPIIKAKLAPNLTVKIEVHSDSVIETVLTTNANGDVILDLASLEADLEPGEHTVFYTYIDPNTGQEVIESYDFIVSTETRAIASADTTQPLPHGTGDPYLPPTSPIPTVASSSPPTVIPTIPSTIDAEATSSVRETVVSTASGTYNAGSVSSTIALLALGLFFLATGLWSFFLAKQFGKD